MQFSVLIPVYIKEKPEFLDRALLSIWDDQELKPNQVVIVKDGPVTNELDSLILNWQKKLKDMITVVPLPENVGLGDALNIGLNHCKYDLVARMDADDISSPSRFSQQIKAMSLHNLDICSSWVSEFNEDENKIDSIRKLPERPEEIISYSKYRSPFNHPSVIIKKSAVMMAGGYKAMPLMEDYFLWLRMLKAGARSRNLQTPLVKMRAGNGMLKRRKGLLYLISEIKFQRAIHKLEITKTYEFIRNILLRAPIRLLPEALLYTTYRKILRSRV